MKQLVAVLRLRSLYTAVITSTFPNTVSRGNTSRHSDHREPCVCKVKNVLNNVVTGKSLLRKFHLGKFHLENSSYGKFLLWKKTM